MKKPQFLELIRAILAVTSARPLVVVGSQSVHGQMRTPPGVVLMSHEVDFFILNTSPDHDVIDEMFGPESPWFAAHGVYADTVGPGIVTLPPGWQGRLISIRGETGEEIYKAAEIHDIGVAKLIAGRDKDYVFLAELLESKVLIIETLMERTGAMRDTAYRGALKPRLEKLAAILRERRWREMLPPVETLIATL